MSRSLAWCLAAAVAAVSVPAGATELTVAHYEAGVVPVLVTVDKAGQVTNLVSSQRLKPSVNHLLRETIDQVVAASGESKLPTAGSQMVLRMRLDSLARSDGQYDLRFVPLDARKVPAGAWRWHIKGSDYALTDGVGWGGPLSSPAALPISKPGQSFSSTQAGSTKSS